MPGVFWMQQEFPDPGILPQLTQKSPAIVCYDCSVININKLAWNRPRSFQGTNQA